MEDKRLIELNALRARWAAEGQTPVSSPSVRLSDLAAMLDLPELAAAARQTEVIYVTMDEYKTLEMSGSMDAQMRETLRIKD